MKNINIYAFSDEASARIDAQITALRRNGLNGMEMRNVDGINVSEISAQKAREVREKLTANGLCVWSIGSPIGKADIRGEAVPEFDKLKHTLEIADILGAKNIRLFSFFMPKDEDPDIYKEEVLYRLERFTEIAKGCDVTLCHENEKGIYGDTAKRCLAIHQALPDIKAVFDPANFVQCGVDTKDAWEKLKSYVHYLHIKDALADGTVVPAGEGEGNVREIVEDYLRCGGTEFTIEPHLKVFEGLENLERGEGLRTRFAYPDNDTAFDVACESFKRLVKE